MSYTKLNDFTNVRYFGVLSGTYCICILSAEIMNLRNLERVLAREEEVKKRAIVHKPEYTGPQIRYFSKNGKYFFRFRIIQSGLMIMPFNVCMSHENALCQFTEVNIS